MKEVMAVIRMNMITPTKEALLKEGFPSITCRKVLGRGKKKVDFTLIESLISSPEDTPNIYMESASESHRLIPKRLISIVVQDEDVKKVVDTLITVNSKGNPGDGKIFVMPVSDVFRIRTGERGPSAV